MATLKFYLATLLGLFLNQSRILNFQIPDVVKIFFSLACIISLLYSIKMSDRNVRGFNISKQKAHTHQMQFAVHFSDSVKYNCFVCFFPPTKHLISKIYYYIALTLVTKFKMWRKWKECWERVIRKIKWTRIAHFRSRFNCSGYHLKRSWI